MNADQIIDALASIAEKNYREGDADRADRLAYHVGLLQSKIREICFEYESMRDQVKQLQIELMEINK